MENVQLGTDVGELIELANDPPWPASYDSRVNTRQPGPGVDGQCIAVDPWFIVDAAPVEATLIHPALIATRGPLR